MSNDYRGFQDRMAGDLAKASMAAHAFGSKNQRVRLMASDIPAIPAGSYIYVEPMPYHKLKPGNIVYVRSGGALCLRRFLHLVIDGLTTQLAVTPGGAPQETIPGNALVGKVVKAEYQKREFDPNREGLLQWIANRFTDYGSLSVGQKIGRSLSGVARVFRRKK